MALAEVYVTRFILAMPVAGTRDRDEHAGEAGWWSGPGPRIQTTICPVSDSSVEVFLLNSGPGRRFPRTSAGLSTSLGRVLALVGGPVWGVR